MRTTATLALLATSTLFGCQTLSDARAAKGQGTTRTYDAPFDTVWKAIPRAANDLDLSIAGTFPEERYYVAERDITAFSWGERVAIFVSDESSSRTTVEVVSKSRGALNVTATNFERPLLDKIGNVLAEKR